MRPKRRAMKLHHVFDRTTGKSSIIGRDGTTYSLDEYEEARRRARAGDAAAQAMLDNVDHTQAWADTSPEEQLRQMLHDCPECRAALERGERPQIGVPVPVEMLEAMWSAKLLATAQPRRPSRWARPRWRELKRR